MRTELQTTLRRNSQIIEGIGIHSDIPVKLQFLRAAAGTGIVFRRLFDDGQPAREVKVDYKAVVATEFATVMGDHSGPLVSTTEHAMAAVRGLGLDNVVIEVDGPEVPIMDGSAKDFTLAIKEAGLQSLPIPRRYLEVVKPVHMRIENSYGKLIPHADGLRVRVDIDFPQSSIGKQSHTLDVTPGVFCRTIANARTFGFIGDMLRLRSAGFALGASFENSIVFNEKRVLNVEGLRYENECARHKVLDVVGDFAIAGLPILGDFHSIRGGHKLNYAVMCALMEDKSAWKIVTRDLAPA